jgi:glycosyltransferase involved in cell wall biosynthesis
LIDVCLCTHNPRPEILEKVLASIANQRISAGAFRLLLVDNASYPAVDETIVHRFYSKGIAARIVREPIPGIARARLRAICETSAELLLFVDDDNELSVDYLAVGLQFAATNSNVGCFGGKLLLPPNIRPPGWTEPFLPYLAIKDIGEVPIFGRSPGWAVWEPPTAGAFIRRSVLDLYKQRAQLDESIFKLGRVGSQNLSSCEDTLIMSGAFSLGLQNAYYPSLVLYHHLSANRFKFKYLIRLMYAYGVSNVILENLTRSKQTVLAIESRWRLLLRIVRATLAASKQSLPFGLGMLAYNVGGHCERLRQRKR